MVLLFSKEIGVLAGNGVGTGNGGGNLANDYLAGAAGTHFFVLWR